MRRISIFFGIAAVALVLSCVAVAQDETNGAMLSIAPTAVTNAEPRVTAVYGVSADDYLPTAESARNRLRPQVRDSMSHPSFDLPDAFYFIGGPIFILLFLRVLVIFLNGFEEQRKEELRTVAREVSDLE